MDVNTTILSEADKNEHVHMSGVCRKHNQITVGLMRENIRENALMLLVYRKTFVTALPVCEISDFLPIGLCYQR